MGKALYRKYRSKNLNEVIGQDHITTTLTNALKNGQISHAYLLTGPRGVGKTSVARILAHEINKLPYSDDKQHLDIIEIDAASNRRIDEIRDLREKSRLAPTSAEYKVYIIDEVHMLTKEAFNALLKTLEEPPAHVVFILATTELHKLPATIISRTQRFAFRPINEIDMVKHLKTISKAEKISIDESALELIANHANGGFRDAISLLDQIKNVSDNITLEDIEIALGRPANTSIKELLSATLSGELSKLYDKLQELYKNGYSASIIAESLLNEGQLELRKSSNPNTLELLDGILKVEMSVNKSIALEVCLIKTAQKNSSVKEEQHTATADNTVKNKNFMEPKKIKKIKGSSDKPLLKKPKTNLKPLENFDEKWAEVLSSIKKTHNTLHGILNNAGATYSDSENSIILSFRFPFHLKKASESKNQIIIKTALSSITSEDYGLIFKKQEKEPAKKSVNATKASSDSVITSVMNVFGGGEVIK